VCRCSYGQKNQLLVAVIPLMWRFPSEGGIEGISAPGEDSRVKNTLYYGDNLDVLRRYVDDDSVDLIYLAPPFQSNQNYNVLFREHDGTKAASQILAFEDTWEWNVVAEQSCLEMIENGGKTSEVMRAFLTFLGKNDMMAYLAMMAPRLVELRRVLKETGSIYLHCDSTASHYLKLLMDGVFGPENFNNEVIWQRTSAHNDPSRYGRVHDSLLFYGKGETHTWVQQFDPPDEAYFKAHDFEKDEQGKLYRKRDLTAPGHGTLSGQYEWNGRRPPSGRMWSYTESNMQGLEAAGRIVYTRTGMPRLKIYAKDLKGVPYQDVWARPDLWLNSAAAERLGYPTQKPQGLLERIISASSKEGDLILDPFCGCGTAIEASEKLGRRWIGIDITNLSVTLIKHRLQDAFGDSIKQTYEVVGEPVSLPDAEALAAEDPYQFQFWALGLVGARPTEPKKGRDQGIDGRIFFHDDQLSRTKQIVLSVKAGRNLTPAFVRDLRGVMEREKAEMGVLITMASPSREMRREATSAGIYTSAWGSHPRLQIFTVEDLLAGHQIDRPPTRAVDPTVKKRVRSVPKPAEQIRLIR
jgi:DNA modification methylase